MLRGNQGISPTSSEKAVTNESGHEGNKDWYFCIQTHSVTSIRSLRSQSIDHSVHNFVCIRAGILGKFTNSLFDCEKRKKDINYGLNIIALFSISGERMQPRRKCEARAKCKSCMRGGAGEHEFLRSSPVPSRMIPTPCLPPLAWKCIIITSVLQAKTLKVGKNIKPWSCT